MTSSTTQKDRRLLVLMGFGALMAAGTITPGVAHAASPVNALNICTALRSGATLGSIEAALETAGYTPRAAGRLTGCMVADHCPEQLAGVRRQLSGTG